MAKIRKETNIADNKGKIKFGIGFVTGRKNFKDLLKTYIHNWNEQGFIKNESVSLNLFIAYDLKYFNTKESDYRDLDHDLLDMVDTVTYIDDPLLAAEKRRLIGEKIINSKQTELLFGEGYGRKRNAVLYFALNQGMDYLLFMDDDEYPVAPVRIDPANIVWKGQNVLASHLKNIQNSDITHGYHCGYISPIPNLTFNRILKEEDFKTFIEAISNDIVDWASIKSKMQTGGITLADNQLLSGASEAYEIQEKQGMKFISGSNLCLNLRHPENTFPFYNPPGARGEDTFLSTCLHKLKVLKVPCYTFHDGFLRYTQLLHGVLPGRLKPVQLQSEFVVNRFLKATVGWVRYKPLLMYITQPSQYDAKIEMIYEKLLKTVPKLCRYFHTREFVGLYREFDRYHKLVRHHYEEFEETKQAWKKITGSLKSLKLNHGEYSFDQELRLSH